VKLEEPESSSRYEFPYAEASHQSGLLRFSRPLRFNERAGKTFIVCKVNEADDNN